ncbi:MULTISPECIES: methyltransferase [Brevibacterium]|uniref:Release factor glutamine methyltransferase n=2 Tax=Brevibacterium TaxID=1696 RepID=A0A1H1WE43_BRESA|nr:methyltransferase [Brevibacterium sandarakinum]SDS94920.1 release factor glutamine methyltransferase [Brevibacterium sandarakinum]
MSCATVVAHLRNAGCVFAEDEAQILLQAAQESFRDTADHDMADRDMADRQESTSSHPTLAELLARRVAGEPLEQIVGWVEFAGQRIAVAPGVFVPRQRTQLLATQSVLALKAASGTARFLEAFCGVGAVATTVSRTDPGTQIHLGDHDETALDCARMNVGAEAHPHLLNTLSGLPQTLAGGFDVISAVPPYVPDSAAEFLPHEALDYEAPTALFGGADGLDLVRRLIGESRQWLAPSGVLLIELGSEQLHRAADFATELGFSTRNTLGEDEQTAVLELQLRD